MNTSEDKCELLKFSHDEVSIVTHELWLRHARLRPARRGTAGAQNESKGSTWSGTHGSVPNLQRNFAPQWTI